MTSLLSSFRLLPRSLAPVTAARLASSACPAPSDPLTTTAMSAASFFDLKAPLPNGTDFDFKVRSLPPYWTGEPSRSWKPDHRTIADWGADPRGQGDPHLQHRLGVRSESPVEPDRSELLTDEISSRRNSPASRRSTRSLRTRESPCSGQCSNRPPDRLLMVGTRFPCNQFGGQEPGSDADVATFCERNHGVTFPLMKKSDVNGANTSESVLPIRAQGHSLTSGTVCTSTSSPRSRVSCSSPRSSGTLRSSSSTRFVPPPSPLVRY